MGKTAAVRTLAASASNRRPCNAPRFGNAHDGGTTKLRARPAHSTRSVPGFANCRAAAARTEA